MRRKDSLVVGPVSTAGLLQSALAVGIVAAAALLLVVGAAPSTSVQIAAPPEISRADVTVTVPKPKPVAPSTHRSYATPSCPQLNNPGGLSWIPRANAGPWATGGVVRIPSQGVAAPIYKVGVDRSGKMVVTHNARDVAWLDQGPFPGNTNNAVIAGHISYSRVRGSFGRIQQLRAGDLVTVEMNGHTWTFQVQWTCLFDRNTTDAARIMGRTTEPSLTMISCGGVFDRRYGTHDKRVAVRAVLVSKT